MKLPVNDRVVLHLNRYNRKQDDFTSPQEVTQMGIADAVGITRPHVAVAVKRLIEEALVVQTTKHIKGSNGKQTKVYYLTVKGKEKAEALLAALKEDGTGIEEALSSPLEIRKHTTLKNRLMNIETVIRQAKERIERLETELKQLAADIDKLEGQQETNGFPESIPLTRLRDGIEGLEAPKEGLRTEVVQSGAKYPLSAFETTLAPSNKEIEL